MEACGNRDSEPTDDDNPRTTTILTVELPPELGERLRSRMRERGHASLHQITLDALEAWLEREERETRP